jgi:hypothetical protein
VLASTTRTDAPAKWGKLTIEIAQFLVHA